MLQEIWAKVNPRERLAVIGAGLILLAWIIGLAAGGYFGAVGTGGLGLLGALAVLVVVYLRYAPNTNVTWPAPYPVVLLAISGLVGVFALLELLQSLSWLGLIAQISILAFVALVVYFIGAALMVWGSYQEWQLSKTTA